MRIFIFKLIHNSIPGVTRKTGIFLKCANIFCPIYCRRKVAGPRNWITLYMLMYELCGGYVIYYFRDTSVEIKQEADSEPASNKYCERTFITFLDDPNDEVFNEKFPNTKPVSKHKPSVCAITG